MIRTLEDLQQFTAKLSEDEPLIAETTLLRAPGCSENEIRQLLGYEPHLPPAYLKCIRRCNLKGISLPGYFNLWPGGAVERGTPVEDFREANSEGCRHAAEFRQMGLFSAASWNDADVCVAKTNSTMFAPDCVVRFGDTDRARNPIVMCRDFEHLLLAAGNVAEIRVEEKEGVPQALMRLLLERLASIGLSAEEVEGWRDVAEVLFGD